MGPLGKRYPDGVLKKADQGNSRSIKPNQGNTVSCWLLRHRRSRTKPQQTAPNRARMFRSRILQSVKSVPDGDAVGNGVLLADHGWFVREAQPVHGRNETGCELQ